MLAVAAKAQFFGYGGYGGYGGRYYPVAPAAPHSYHGVPARHVAPWVRKPSYAHPGQAASNYRDGFDNQIGSYAYINPEGKEVRPS